MEILNNGKYSYYNKCEECGSEYTEECSLYVVEDKILCCNCYRTLFTYCKKCGKRINKSDENSYVRDGYHIYCQDCYEEMPTCACCGRKSWQLENILGDLVCPNCKNCRCDYHEHEHYDLKWYCKGEDGKNRETKPKYNGKKYIGIELEMDANRIDNYRNADDEDYDDYDEDEEDNENYNRMSRVSYGLIKALNNEVYCEEDGSLSSNGIELITHPHTECALYNMDWQKAFDFAIENDYRSHDIGSCGLHMHFNNAFFGTNEIDRTDNIAKLITFYHRNFQDIIKLSRRSTDQVRSWANDYNFEGKEDDVENHAKAISLNKSNYGRYYAVNINTHKDTVEIRIMRGTLNYETFIATINFVIETVKQTRKLSWEDVLKPEKWLETLRPKTITYLKDRGVFVDAIEKLEGEQE